MEPEVLIEHDDGIVTINRPHQRNAVTRAVSYGVCAAIDEMDRNPALRIAMEIALTGDMIGAERLYRFGMINTLTEPGGALEAARAMAHRILANAPLSVAASKRVMVEQRDWPLAEMFTRQQEITGPILASRDAREGAAAFAERRDPVWRGE